VAGRRQEGGVRGQLRRGDAAVVDTPDPEFLKRLEDAVERLPRRTREIFLAHRVHDLSYSEIASRTGLSVRQVKRHMTKAILGIDRDLHEPPLRWWQRLFGLW
jgi:DNA-directed RNA polymerase specialized sigma24 family protein